MLQLKPLQKPLKNRKGGYNASIEVCGYICQAPVLPAPINTAVHLLNSLCLLQPRQVGYASGIVHAVSSLQRILDGRMAVLLSKLAVHGHSPAGQWVSPKLDHALFMTSAAK